MIVNYCLFVFLSGFLCASRKSETWRARWCSLTRWSMMTVGHRWHLLRLSRCTRSLPSMNAMGQQLWRQGKHCVCRYVSCDYQNQEMPKTYLLLICELTRSIWPVGCKKPRYHTSLGMLSQVPGPTVWGICWATWNIYSTSQRPWQTLTKALTCSMTDNPEQWINREVPNPFPVNAMVLLCAPQFATTAVHVLHAHNVVKGYWWISFFPLKTRTVFGQH